MTVTAGFEPFSCVAIVGVGMMGGSLGLALRTRGLARQVAGIDLHAETLARAREMGAIDRGSTDLAEGMRGADGVVLATPVSAIPALLAAMAPHVRPDALLTDLGSAKAEIVAAGHRLYGARFVGGHPMAGSERGGIAAAQADLFVGAAWAIVRPEPFDFATDPQAARLAALATALGARPIPLEADRHDRVVALVSHLPHLLSFAYAQTVATSDEVELARSMAGGSYRDLMRVSQADPNLWRDIFHQNRDCLRTAIALYEAQLQALKARYGLDESPE